jgi:hypothetical protein
MIAAGTRPLSLAELEAFGPSSRGGGAERRFCCPLDDCADMPRDAEHRNLGANMETGTWQCFRCGARGKLVEYWAPRPGRRERLATLREAFGLAQPETTARAAPERQAWKRRLEEVRPLLGSPAADYLRSRGIEPDLAALAGVGYVEAWRHWEKRDGPWELLGADRRVTFPLTSHAGELVAISARAIDQDSLGPKVDTRGDKSAGVFATPGARWADPLVICEAPIDALSLALAGYPALALCGTTGPDWLRSPAAFRTVLLATDADEAGDRAAGEIAATLTLRSKVYRLRPPVAKDWNDELLHLGADGVRALVAAAIPAAPAPPADPAEVVETDRPLPPAPSTATAGPERMAHEAAAALLALGPELGWPELKYYGLTLKAGEDDWRRTCAFPAPCAVPMLELARGLRLAAGDGQL